MLKYFVELFNFQQVFDTEFNGYGRISDVDHLLVAS